MALEAPEREVDIARLALAQITDRLPVGWSTGALNIAEVPDVRADFVAQLTAPDGTKSLLIMEVKRHPDVRDLPRVMKQLRHFSASPHLIPILTGRYFTPSVRGWLEEHDLSYVDATGNLRITSGKPALFLRDRGADKDPWRGPGRPRGSLQDPIAARVVRALVDLPEPLSVPELVRRAGTSTGATYRVVEFLEREALLERQPRGPIINVKWRQIIERWSQDYGFQASNAVAGYLEPRGLQTLLDRLSGTSDLRYALTGSVAAHRFAPYAPARMAAIYVDDAQQAAAELDLRPVDSGANVLLAATEYHVVFERTTSADGLRLVAPAQAAVDLLTGPGRNPAEAQALLDWMEKNERSWRQ
ncbi:MAG TPA: hypothetical protein DGG94_13235 [Micromonosporaceae bacterium]|nr:hypothetical protein [Micromonosporaceae bacterium]HCU50741.1 hypothetical protein [Micromonosporaceae bacterium]